MQDESPEIHNTSITTVRSENTPKVVAHTDSEVVKQLREIESNKESILMNSLHI